MTQQHFKSLPPCTVGNKRSAIIALARQQRPDIGDGAMIVEGEWYYCVAGSTFVSNQAVANAMKREKGNG